MAKYSSTGDNFAIGFGLAWLAVLAVGLVGWVLNIAKIVGMLSGDINAMLVARIVGVFAAPLGAVLGFI